MSLKCPVFICLGDQGAMLQRGRTNRPPFALSKALAAKMKRFFDLSLISSLRLAVRPDIVGSATHSEKQATA
jgi:hypothetical protein